MRRPSIVVTVFAAAASVLLAAPALAQDAPKIKPGSDSPSIEGLALVSGDEASLSAALDAKVTVVEFWATWCAPCKRAIPHINDLYKTLKPKGLEVVGISVDDKRDPVDPFVRQKGDAMSYLVAWDGEGVAKKWMEAAGQKGIPCSFIVSNKKLLWVGNPLDKQFDRILHLAMSGRYDPIITPKGEPLLEAARSAAKKGNFSQATTHYDAALALGERVMFDAALEKYEMLAVQQADAAAAKAWATACLDTYGDSAPELTSLALYLATDTGLTDHDLESARAAAAKAVEATTESDAEALAALARVQFLQGDAEAAYATQRKAYRVASPEAKAQFKADLDGYKASAKAAVGG